MAPSAIIRSDESSMLRGLRMAVLGAVLGLATACTGLAGAQAQGASLGRVGVTSLRPQCEGVQSCLLGHVVTARTARPLSSAAVFLEQEDAVGPSAPRFVRLTDEQGVFTVVDLPPGRYRVAVYKDSGHEEVRGLELGAPGTTLLAVRVPIQ
jgi:hypothetical protein